MGSTRRRGGREGRVGGKVVGGGCRLRRFLYAAATLLLPPPVAAPPRLPHLLFFGVCVCGSNSVPAFGFRIVSWGLTCPPAPPSPVTPPLPQALSSGVTAGWQVTTGNSIGTICGWQDYMVDGRFPTIDGSTGTTSIEYSTSCLTGTIPTQVSKRRAAKH